MITIVRPRMQGKTEELIRLNAQLGGYIVCRSIEAASQIFNRAKKGGYNIPVPFTYRELLNKEYYPKGVKKIWIDDVDALLHYIAPEVEIGGITITEDES